jgi:hypothetical protein
MRAQLRTVPSMIRISSANGLNEWISGFRNGLTVGYWEKSQWASYYVYLRLSHERIGSGVTSMDGMNELFVCS